MQWSILEMVNAIVFYTFAIVFSTPENLSVGISEALGMKESHLLSKNLFWENVMGYLRNDQCWSFQTFFIIFRNPENLLVRFSVGLGIKESYFLSKNMFSENAGENPWKLTWRVYQRSRNKKKPHSQLKHVLTECSGVSWKWWML